MYGKCGLINIAKQIFDDIEYENKDISVYNAMINAFGRNNEADNGYKLYLEIKNNNLDILPNDKTYIQLINGFSHCGQVEKAYEIWENDINDEKIKYNCYVSTALIDGLSRKGMINMALEIIGQYENYYKNDTNMFHSSMWISLLNGCKLYKNIDENKNLGYYIYEQIKLRFEHDKNVIA
eukprot:308326_1